MINLIGAYITLIFLLAIAYHRPPLKQYDEFLEKNAIVSTVLLIFCVVFLLHELAGILAAGSVFYPLYLIDFAIETTTLWIHEAGHVYWSIFGRTLAVLGGTLNEVVFPLLLFSYCFWIKAYRFSALAIFWLGKNCFGIAEYMADARARKLPLLGGAEIHDWEYLFRSLGVLQYDVTISWLIYSLGVVLSLLGIGYLALKTFAFNFKWTKSLFESIKELTSK